MEIKLPAMLWFAMVAGAAVSFYLLVIATCAWAEWREARHKRTQRRRAFGRQNALSIHLTSEA